MKDISVRSVFLKRETAKKVIQFHQMQYFLPKAKKAYLNRGNSKILIPISNCKHSYKCVILHNAYYQDTLVHNNTIIKIILNVLLFITILKSTALSY